MKALSFYFLLLTFVFSCTLPQRAEVQKTTVDSLKKGYVETYSEQELKKLRKYSEEISEYCLKRSYDKELEVFCFFKGKVILLVEKMKNGEFETFIFFNK